MIYSLIQAKKNAWVQSGDCAVRGYELIPGLGAAEGLGDFWAGAIHDSKLGLVPVWLPNLLDHTQKVLDKPLLNRILNEALPDLPPPSLPDGVRQVVVYYIDLDDEQDLRAFMAEYNPTEIQVELRDLKQVLHEVVANDIVEYELEQAKDGYTVQLTRFLSDRLMSKIDAYNQRRAVNNGRHKTRQTELAEANGNGNDEDGNGQNGSGGDFRPIEISDTGLELIELVSLDCTAADGVWHSDAEIKIDKKGYVILNGARTRMFWNAKINSPHKPLRLKVRNIAGDETVIAL